MQASHAIAGWEHVLLLTKTGKESFEGGLAGCHTRWKKFLNERKVDVAGKNRYVCKRLEMPVEASKQTCPRYLNGMITCT